MWKKNWEESKQHFIDWWKREDLVIGSWGDVQGDGSVHEEVSQPEKPESARDIYLNTEERARRNHFNLARRSFPADVLPASNTDMGPGSLCLFLGCKPEFSPGTVWFHPCIDNCKNPEDLPPFRFDESNEWWQLTKATLENCIEMSQGKYMVGCPDLVENIDVLASLRDPQILLMDMIERPDWVEEKVKEINLVWMEAYQRIYDIIKQEDGSSLFGAFRAWGPGKTAKLQCDASAMFSPEMFNQFVVPCLTEQCQWLDNSLYHLDGTQAECHLDSLLSIEPLDAIEWTPQAGIEQGGDPRWYPMYKEILGAGKCVQVTGITPDEIVPLFDTVGAKGIYILTNFSSQQEAEKLMSKVEQFR